MGWTKCYSDIKSTLNLRVDYKVKNETIQGPKRYVDQTFLRPSVYGPKHVGRIVTRTKGRGIKCQGTLNILAIGNRVQKY
jgi:hypothetical protein